MKRIGSVLAAAWLGWGMAAFGAEPEGWRFEVTPCFWLSGLEGDVTLSGQTVDFNRTPGDLLDHVRLGGSLLGVVQYNRLVLGGQADFISLRNNRVEVEGRPGTGSLDTDVLLGRIALGYQFDGWSEGQSFVVAAGVRHARMMNQLDVSGRGEMSTNIYATDPLLVVWPNLPIFRSWIPGLVLNPAFSLGGGGDSKFVFELFPALRYQISDTLVARFGYRTVGYRLEDGDDELNFRMAGLIGGVGATF